MGSVVASIMSFITASIVLYGMSSSMGFSNARLLRLYSGLCRTMGSTMGSVAHSTVRFIMAFIVGCFMSPIMASMVASTMGFSVSLPL